MNIQDIVIIGVTNHNIENNPKSSTFLFEDKSHSLCGMVYFTGAYWQVYSISGEVEQSIKEKLRRKISNALPNQFSIIEEPILYFHNQDYPLNYPDLKERDSCFNGNCLSFLRFNHL